MKDQMNAETPPLIDEIREEIEGIDGLKFSLCELRGSCFNLIAKKDNTGMIIKSARNIGNIPKDSLQNLKKIARSLLAAPLLIGLVASKRQMEDDAVYSHHGVYAITPATFIKMIKNSELPIIEVKAGGFYVNIDGEKIRRKREELNISLGELSSLLNISRKTLYEYERGKSRCTIDVALKLQQVLGLPLIKHIDILKKEEEEPELNSSAKKPHVLSEETYKKFRELGYSVTFVDKAPFDFILRDKEGKPILGVSLKDNAKTLKKLDVTLSVAETIEVPFLLIGKKKIKDYKTLTEQNIWNMKSRSELQEFTNC